jgi:competence protein ComGC
VVQTPTTLGGFAGAASRQACAEDARLVQQASDAYQVKNGHPAASIEVLVSNGDLRSSPSTSHGYVISYDAQNGKVTATGACDVP